MARKVVTSTVEEPLKGRNDGVHTVVGCFTIDVVLFR